MNYELDFEGQPGDVAATLTYGGEPVAHTDGLRDGKAARNWAKKAAEDHKAAQTIEEHYEKHTIKGSSSFVV